MRPWKYIKTKQKTTVKIYKVYIICTPKCDAFRNNLFPLLSIMECFRDKQITNALSFLASILGKI